LRQSLIILVLILGCGRVFGGGGFYDADRVHEIQIYFPQADWDAILDSLYARGQEERLVGTVIIDGVRYNDVGIRYKGHRSYHPDRDKNPLNIKLDYVHKKQEIEGCGTLRLTNIWDDPSCVREVLGYEIAGKYLPAPRADYAVVTVNDTLRGLYVNVQDIDGLFLRTHFGKGVKTLFKGEYSGSPRGHVVWGYLGPDSTPYGELYELESKSGWSDLIAFLDTINHHPEAAPRVLNIDRHLWMLAYDNLLVNLDAPINAAHNYYLCRDDAGRFNPIIWDLHLNFGAFPRLIAEDRELTVEELQCLDPFLHLDHPAYPIVRAVLCNPEYRKMYVAHMRTILRENFADGWYLTRGRRLQEIIAPYVLSDPHPFAPHDTFRRNLEEPVVVDTAIIAGIAQLMTGRTAYIDSLPEFQYQAPVINDITTIPPDLGAEGDIPIRAVVRYADRVTVGYRYGATDPFEKQSMVDDGRTAAGDRIFGVTLPVKRAGLRYYFYAANEKAAAFLPERAEYEDIVIDAASPRRHEDK
jgi:hypothetical protein